MGKTPKRILQRKAKRQAPSNYRTSPTKVGGGLREMVDVHAPPIGLLAKLGSIIVHVDEGLGRGGHEFDLSAIRTLIADREVQEWLAGMDSLSLLPRKRP